MNYQTWAWYVEPLKLAVDVTGDGGLRWAVFPLSLQLFCLFPGVHKQDLFKGIMKQIQGCQLCSRPKEEISVIYNRDRQAHRKIFPRKRMKFISGNSCC